eukprot:TRINITY_DN22687_c3_g1_i1.p1 TRINITY_DN22687_c3_g1~~TRINITY_DN22687_c3_g1_i1.p1  ORF type:complete len:857 (+),score=345.32 TRINITY_DN22687_c3_g1_i1:66-2573(+)
MSAPGALCVHAPSRPEAHGLYQLRLDGSGGTVWVGRGAQRVCLSSRGCWTVGAEGGEEWLRVVGRGGQWPHEASEWAAHSGGVWVPDTSVSVSAAQGGAVALMRVGSTTWRTADGGTVWTSSASGPGASGEQWRLKTDKQGRRFFVSQTGAKRWALPDSAEAAPSEAPGESPPRGPAAASSLLAEQVEQQRRTIEALEEKEAVYLAFEERVLDPSRSPAAESAEMQMEREYMQQQVNDYYHRAGQALSAAQRDLSDRAQSHLRALEQEREEMQADFAARERGLLCRLAAASPGAGSAVGGVAVPADVERERAELRGDEEALRELAAEVAAGREKAASAERARLAEEGELAAEQAQQERLRGELRELAAARDALQSELQREREGLRGERAAREARALELGEAQREAAAAAAERELERFTAALKAELQAEGHAAAAAANEAEKAAAAAERSAAQVAAQCAAAEQELLDLRVAHERDRARLQRAAGRGAALREAAEAASRESAADLRQQLAAARRGAERLAEAEERARAAAQRMREADRASQEWRAACAQREDELRRAAAREREAAEAVSRRTREAREQRIALGEERRREAEEAARRDTQQEHAAELRALREQAAAEQQGLVADREHDSEVARELLERTRRGGEEAAAALRRELAARQAGTADALGGAREAAAAEVAELRHSLSEVQREAEQLREEAAAQRRSQGELRRAVEVERARGAQGEQALLSELARARARLQQSGRSAGEARCVLREQLHTMLDAELAMAGECAAPQSRGAAWRSRSAESYPALPAGGITGRPPQHGAAPSESDAPPRAQGSAEADLQRLKMLKEQVRARLQR